MKRVTDIIGGDRGGSQEQSTGIEQVNQAITQMDQVTQGNAAQMQELSSTVQSLAAQAEEPRRWWGSSGSPTARTGRERRPMAVPASARRGR